MHTEAASHFESTSSTRLCQAQITVNHTDAGPTPPWDRGVEPGRNEPP